MASEGSVTGWLQRLKDGDAKFADHLWDRFFRRMARLARHESPPWVTRGHYDEEDIAAITFTHFCRGIMDGRFPDLHDREELWRLLATMTVRKAREQARKSRAQKRSGEVSLTEDDDESPLDLVPDQTLPPDLMLMLQEESSRMLALLPDEELRSVALWKLEGHTNDEIGQMMGCTRRTVQRMLSLIRQLWDHAA